MNNYSMKIPYFLCIIVTAVFLSNTSVQADMEDSYSNMTLSHLRLALWYEGHEASHDQNEGENESQRVSHGDKEPQSQKELPEELSRALQKALEIVS